MKWLLDHNADINSFVTRDHRVHYGVLHDAIWAEGRGVQEDFVRLLLKKIGDDAGRQLDMNGNKETPLELAFRVGAPQLIDLLREKQKKYSVTKNPLTLLYAAAILFLDPSEIPVVYTLKKDDRFSFYNKK